MSVATSYLLSLYSDTAHKTPAPPTMWGGTGGIVAQVRRHMKVAQGSSGSVRKIIEHAYLCWCEGEAYTGEQDPAGGHNKLIQRGSVEERIATNAIENRLGYTVATELVNIYRVHEGKPPVGRSAVYSAILRLIDAGVGRTVRPKKRKQGAPTGSAAAPVDLVDSSDGEGNGPAPRKGVDVDSDDSAMGDTEEG